MILGHEMKTDEILEVLTETAKLLNRAAPTNNLETRRLKAAFTSITVAIVLLEDFCQENPDFEF